MIFLKLTHADPHGDVGSLSKVLSTNEPCYTRPCRVSQARLVMTIQTGTASQALKSCCSSPPSKVNLLK
jgi:hypothetical protein